jgi:hypothetical protein
VITLPTYTASVENSYTTDYTTGDVVAKADGEIYGWWSDV